MKKSVRHSRVDGGGLCFAPRLLKIILIATAQSNPDTKVLILTWKS